MKVKQLIEELKKFDPNADVGFVYQYGDRQRSECVGEIDTIKEETVRWSGYCDSLKVVEPGDENADSKTYVVLSS